MTVHYLDLPYGEYLCEIEKADWDFSELTVDLIVSEGQHAGCRASFTLDCFGIFYQDWVQATKRCISKNEVGCSVGLILDDILAPNGTWTQVRLVPADSIQSDIPGEGEEPPPINEDCRPNNNLRTVGG